MRGLREGRRTAAVTKCGCGTVSHKTPRQIIHLRQCNVPEALGFRSGCIKKANLSHLQHTPNNATPPFKLTNSANEALHQGDGLTHLHSAVLLCTDSSMACDKRRTSHIKIPDVHDLKWVYAYGKGTCSSSVYHPAEVGAELLLLRRSFFLQRSVPWLIFPGAKKIKSGPQNTTAITECVLCYCLDFHQIFLTERKHFRNICLMYIDLEINENWNHDTLAKRGIM